MQNYPELLPNLVIVPRDAQVQAQQTLSDLRNSAISQGAEQAMQYGARFGQPLLYGLTLSGMGRAALNHPSVAPTITAISATQLGRPIVNGLQRVVNNPLTQKADKAMSKMIDWIF